ncbi:MAG: hypothetical protein LBN11_00835, partial [Tannerella sp.]|nr:hypothetical protein [Tannerella sp.]
MKPKIKKRNGFVLIGLLLIPMYLFSQNQRIFVNTGAMHVGSHITTAPTDTALAVFGSMVTQGAALTVQEKVTTLTGNFYHDATTHAFAVDAYGWGVSPGTIVFKQGSAGVDRTITATNLEDGTGVAFNRRTNYAAFPNIKMAANENLLIPAQMGLDAQSITATNTGKMILKSDVVSGKVYDASLRISGNNGNADVQAGSVIIERDLKQYRAGTQPLFAFASPMTNLRSGYFAGNFVRKTLKGDNNHVQYVFGNKPDASGYIAREQYLTDPQNHTFVPGEAYLVQARATGFHYEDLKTAGGLTVTGISAIFPLYDQAVFSFNGSPYNLGAVPEQVFAANQLF